VLTKAGELVRAAQRNLNDAILEVVANTSGEARYEGYDVDHHDDKMSDNRRFVEKVRAIRQQLEDLEFVDFL
jgi:hypothetical protein